MPAKRGRPKGAGNRKYRNADEQLCIEMAKHRLLKPSLSSWDAARKVAPGAIGYDGDSSHQGKCVRRLHEQYVRDEVRFQRLARLRLNPPRRLSALEFAAAVQRSLAFRNSILRRLKSR
jgi:hypothetical protein